MIQTSHVGGYYQDSGRGGNPMHKHMGNYSASQPSIFEREIQKRNVDSGNEEFKGAYMQPDSGNNQNIEMIERNEDGVGELAEEEAGNGIDKLDLYHVELTGMCTDKDQSDYTKMLSEFA